MFSLALASLALLPYALAAPHPAPHADPIHIPIVRRSVAGQDRLASLVHNMNFIRRKYGLSSVSHKRSTISSSITDEQADTSYSAVVSFGTPAQEFNLILDTGSSDLWVATNQCSSCTSDVPLFNPEKSSTYKNDSSLIQITYGSGSVTGYDSQDTVSFSGFSMSNQQLVSVTSTSDGLLSDGLSGIMGLAFQPLSQLNTTPFWQVTYSQNKLSSPVFAFYIQRYINQAQAPNAAPGGIFTFGGTNTSLYTGDIEFLNMPSGSTPSFWFQQVQSMTVQGKTVSVPSSQGLAAIDTGTTLIGAPSAIAKAFWSHVPGSVALGDSSQGMYAFPCNTVINSTISFGGTQWPISAADMNLGQISTGSSTQMCGGGLFDIGNTAGSGPGTPDWIVGDTFLKNVYSVFQANPPSVGFARLADGLNSNTSPGSATYTGGTNGPLPTSPVVNSALPRTSLSVPLGLVTSLLASFFITL